MSTVARRVVAASALVVGALGVSLIVVEVALRLINPAPKTYEMLLPGTQVFEPDSTYVLGIRGPARYVVNRRGLRGRDFGPDSLEYRLLLVGGSTTECGMLDESENWGAVAERDLARTRDGRRVWVGNVGRSGLTSRDHVVTVKYLLPEFPRIDVVVVLVGVNDLTSALRQTSYRSPAPLNDPDAEAAQVKNAFAVSPLGFRESLTAEGPAPKIPWYKKTQIYQLAKRARTGWQARRVVRGIAGSLLGQWRANRQSASRIIDSLPDLTRPLADYKQYLEAIVANARRGHADVVFMTQPVLWKERMTPFEEQLIWLGGTGAFQEEPGHAYYSTGALARAMDRYNQVLLRVCAEQSLACLDLASRIPRDTTMFYDDVHYTEAGAARVGQLLAAHLRTSRPAVFSPVTRSLVVRRRRSGAPAGPLRAASD